MRLDRRTSMAKLELIDGIILIALIAIVLSHGAVNSLRATTDLESLIFVCFGVPAIAAKVRRGATSEAKLTTERICLYVTITIFAFVLFTIENSILT
jgi:hypothetical protein